MSWARQTNWPALKIQRHFDACAWVVVVVFVGVVVLPVVAVDAWMQAECDQLTTFLYLAIPIRPSGAL